MKLLIEGCEYDKTLLKNILGKTFADEALDGNGRFRYVGYIWNDNENKAVFFLPKVIVYKPDDDEPPQNADGGKETPQSGSGENHGKKGWVFGQIDPNILADNDLNDIVCSEKAQNDPTRNVSQKQKDFLLNFAIWIYRALAVFKKTNTDKSVALEANSKHSPCGTKRVCETRIDVILAILDFYRRNRDFVVFTAKRYHSGFNKVNWTKTVSKRTPIFQSPNEPVYMQTENRKKRVNFEEELLVIFHSILHYITETWGFPVRFDLNYKPISGAQFQRYMSGYGAARLRTIKYRYFSDKLLELWELCYLFFDKMRSSKPTSTPSEYLFAKKFDVVFEEMIDNLIGAPNLPESLGNLKEQKDGKRADHIFFGTSLCGTILGNDIEQRSVCYVGDSKYYGIDNEVGGESIAKQFTYARNVIQWNIDQYLANKKDKETECFPMLRDTVTEGYDIVPNFFISAFAGTGKKTKDDKPIFDGKGQLVFDEKGLVFDADGFYARKWKEKCFSRQFENRLFDRDTLHIAHFGVNFFFIIALYGRNNVAEKDRWKNKAHEEIRDSILMNLDGQYDFYELKLRGDNTDNNATKFIGANFFDSDEKNRMYGKVISFPSGTENRKYLLALEKYNENETGILQCLKSDTSPFTLPARRGPQSGSGSGSRWGWVGDMPH